MRKREALKTPLLSAVAGLQGLDFSRLASPPGADWLQQWEDRAAARCLSGGVDALVGGLVLC